MRNFNLGCAVGAIAVAIVASAPAQAQETTSSIQGTVTANGAPVAGAAVTITHIPSGTRSTATTNASGTFNALGLRVGGPFSVVVNATGYPSAEVNDIETVAGQPFTLPVELAEQGGQEIVVSATSIKSARSVSQGPVTLLTSTDIAKVATVNRDIRDLSRRDPFARLDDNGNGVNRSISFAGQNPRYNRFTVDGVPITDNFGLNQDGLPSRRSPIPLDAVGQFQAKVAPYDVRDGNFQGGAINIVLRSGTNDFQGTGFFAYSDQSLTGKKTKPGPGIPTGRVNQGNFKYKNYGAEISGPIIKDKLFFMIAAERIRAPLPIAEGPSDNNSGTAISNLTQAQVDAVSAIAQSRYGYDTGGVLDNNGDKDDRLVAKLDANLSDTQRLSLTYTYAKDAINLVQNAFPTAPQGLGLTSNGYVQGNRLHTGVAQLNSQWNDDFSTEVRGFYKDYVRVQDPILGRGFAQFQVCTAPTSDRATAGAAATANINCPTNFASVSLGPDISRQTNALTSNTWGGFVQARLTKGDHNIRAFVDVQSTTAFNSFLQRSAGDYYFDSIADFQAGNAQRFRYGNAIPSLVPEAGAASFKYQAYTFGIMDTWKITPEFNMSYGLRYDLYGGHSRAVVNPNFVNRYGFANNAYLSGRGILQPRFGFDYKPTSRLNIRGGLGVFAGGTPDVYFANSFSNTGVLTNSIEVQQANSGAYTGTGVNATNGAAILSNVNGATIPTAANALLLNAATSANSTTNAVDPNFKLPSQLRGTLSATYNADLGPLGDDWEFGADVFYSKVRNQVFFSDLRVRPNGSLTPDGRQRYTPITSFADTNSDIFLTNSKKGRSYVYVARLNKTFDIGVDAGVSFTYQDIKDQNPATSSTAGSNYAAGVSFDPNGPAYGVANDEVKYAFKYNLSFEKEFFGDNKTTISLFGETRIGRPYSFTFRDTAARSQIFGTIGTGTRYLLYVPTGVNDPKVSFDTAANAAAFDAYVNATGLDKYRGKVAPRNGFNSRWFTKIDLHFSQELPTGLGDSKVTLFADIENFTNLLNKKWGQIREYQFPYTISPVTVTCLTAPVATGTAPGTATGANAGAPCVQYRYTPTTSTGGVFTAPVETIYPRVSLYQIRVGVRFSF